MIQVKGPKTLTWTHHARDKMRYYRLSEARVRRVLHTPLRIEEGIAEDTIAMMQPAGSARNPYEIWVMIQDKKKERTVISTWRYPGRTKLGTPLPPEVLARLRELV